MDYLYWILIVGLFVLSFAGIVFPIIPSVVVLWGGFLIYQFLIESGNLSLFFWISMGLFTVLLIVADFIANSYFVKKYGGSKWGERMAAVGLIVGSFIVPPFGILIVPFVAVLLTELLQKRTLKEAFLVGFGSLMGFLGGSFAKAVIQLIMIIWFMVEVVI
ncbi:DUF456 domain-containing protein [Ammoniphilus sp. YIM 78166]|uniref:DUF456 domain-containing protein n=1 Tax=Ammoniphilus sp. YIM 78166 TaxID=1644106 RepID=UPI00106FB31F|nr:DUF456 domain-containing protein [Ammoniphilus sp. YIM 78166]